MKALDALIEAIASQDRSGWVVADAVAALPPLDDEGYPMTLEKVSREIFERLGVERSPESLGVYRATALAFPASESAFRSAINFSAAAALRAHPEKARAWIKKHPGKALTQREAATLRPSTSAAKPPTVVSQLAKATRVLDSIAELEPDRVVDHLRGLADKYEKMYAKRIAKARRGDLRAV